MKQRSRYVTLALALVLLAGSAMPTRAQALLAATALTVGVAVAAISSGSVAAADDMAPDLSIAIKMDHANHTYRPGEQMMFEFVLQNHGATPTHPFVNILIPAKFTEVAIGNYVLDHCVVKPPTPSIPGHYINCEAPPEPQGRLLNPRSIFVLANAPGESGQYAITAGIGTVHHEERNYDGPNNNAAQPLFVASPPNRFREVPGTCISRQC